MTYYLVHDIEPGDPVPFYIIASDISFWSNWKPTIEKCFTKRYEDDDIELPDMNDPDYPVHTIELDNFSYEEFANKYPELLL